MSVYSFLNDYGEGCHPAILEALSSTNLLQETGYGEDEFCVAAAERLREEIKNPKADIHFTVGATQANLIIISSILRPYESVVAAKTGHIAVHEAGAIEATGHKVNVVETPEGKLSPREVAQVLDIHVDEHMVKPKLVYISNTTEIGTVYTKEELSQLSAFCKRNDLILFLDGSRLGQALASRENDMTMSELSALVDIFYIGGTKNGALFGEAIVINNDSLKENFRFNMKQKGALMAKGRSLGIQFLELFKDNRFYDNARHADNMAMKIADAMIKHGYSFLVKPASNQIFPIVSDRQIELLKEKYDFYVWSRVDDDKSSLRIVTSWATPESFVDAFIEDVLGG